LTLNVAGYYVRVSSTSEVKEKVLNYVSVMARPMVMYQNDHPIQWTPVYAGGKVWLQIIFFSLCATAPSGPESPHSWGF